VTINKGVSVLTSSVAPLLNPFIYTLRNKQVKHAFNNSMMKIAFLSKKKFCRIRVKWKKFPNYFTLSSNLFPFCNSFRSTFLITNILSWFQPYQTFFFQTKLILFSHIVKLNRHFQEFFPIFFFIDLGKEEQW
jgi:hypothetical protein